MKKYALTTLVILGLSPFLTNCASQDDVSTINYQIRSLNQKIENLREDPTVDQMQQRQASYSELTDQLQTDILRLRGEIEESGHLTRMLQEQNKELQQALLNLKTQQEELLNNKIADFDARLRAQEEALSGIRKARIEDAQRRSKLAAQAAEDAMRKANSFTRPQRGNHIKPRANKVMYSPGTSSSQNNSAVASTPLAPRPSAQMTAGGGVTETPGDLFSQGSAKFRQGKYKEASRLFEQHIKEKGNNQSTIQARYMMGECLFYQAEYDQAIIQYQQIISNFPGNPQAAKALLRQGDAFEQLSDIDTAKIIYKKVIASYGSTPEADTAKQRLSSL